MNDNDTHPLNWSPYDWLIEMEKQMNTLSHKTQQLIRNQKEMAIAYNEQAKNMKDLTQRIDTLESILWRGDSSSAIKEYWNLVGKPQR